MPLQVDRLQASLLREQVVTLLRDAIKDMRLAPGERITERQLVESTGVSRATAREALRHLAAEGFVTAVPQRGIVVASPTRKEARNIYDARAVLEGLAGRLCARQASEDDLKNLRARFLEVERVMTVSENTRERLAVKTAFYEALLQGADNPTLVSLLAPLQAKITVLRATSMAQPGRGESAVQEIRDILEAVERRDEQGAFDACVRHVEQAASAALGALPEVLPVD